MSRRVAFWVLVVSPVLVLGLAFLLGKVLNLLGAECVTIGNNPMGFDNRTTCNSLGTIRESSEWIGIGLAILLLPVAVITGAVAAWRRLH